MEINSNGCFPGNSFVSFVGKVEESLLGCLVGLG